jgi:hypothetical protein
MSEINRRSSRRRWVVLLLGGAVLLAAVLVSGAAAGSSSNGPPQTRVYGGGNIPVNSCTDGATTFCTSYTREFSILAVHDPNDDVTYGTITVGSVESGGVVFAVRVTCLAVSGNVAEVGGVIVQDAFDPSFVGGPLELFLRDSGQPGTASRDGVSPNFIDQPPVKPTCRDVSGDAFGYGFFPLTNGDIAIQNLINQNS